MFKNKRCSVAKTKRAHQRKRQSSGGESRKLPGVQHNVYIIHSKVRIMVIHGKK